MFLVGCVIWKNKILDLECWIDLKSVPQSFIYGSPYLGAAAATQTNQTTQAGLTMQIPAAAQLSHAAAIAAATSQFYEYQVSFFLVEKTIFLGDLGFYTNSFSDFFWFWSFFVQR